MVARLIGLLLVACVCAAQTAVISGVVTDAGTRLPLQGAAVVVGGSTMRTDAEGRYSLKIAPSSGIQVSAHRMGYFVPASSGATVDLAPGETVVRNFELRAMLKISGVVEDYNTGERITGCHVFAMRRIYALGRAWHVPAGLATADTRSGQFEIHNLEPGDYVLEIVPEVVTPITAPGEKAAALKKFHGWSYYPDAGRIDMAAPITVTEGGDTSLNIRLRKREPRIISGMVTMAAELELIRYVGDEMRTVAGGTLAGAGPFRIGDVPEGDYHLIAVSANGMRADVAVSVGDRDVADVTVSPRRGGTIAGTVRMDDGSRLPEKVRFGIRPLRPARSVTDEKQVDVAANGRFEIGTPPGDYSVRITGLPSGYAMAEVGERTLTVDGSGPDLSYVVTRRIGTVAGDVKDREFVLWPGGSTMSGVFALDIAPGKYQVLRLEGDEGKLVADREFLKAKTALSETIEVKAGETVVVRVP